MSKSAAISEVTIAARRSIVFLISSSVTSIPDNSSRTARHLWPAVSGNSYEISQLMLPDSLWHSCRTAYNFILTILSYFYLFMYIKASLLPHFYVSVRKSLKKHTCNFNAIQNRPPRTGSSGMPVFVITVQCCPKVQRITLILSPPPEDRPDDGNEFLDGLPIKNSQLRRRQRFPRAFAVKLNVLHKRI